VKVALRPIKIKDGMDVVQCTFNNLYLSKGQITERNRNLISKHCLEGNGSGYNKNV